MKFVKSTTLAVALSLCSITAHAGGIPVIDSAQIGNQIQTWVVEAQRWQKEIAQYKQDFENQQNQLLQQTGILSTLQGIRDVEGFINDVTNELKDVTNLDKWISQSDYILKNGYDVLGSDLKKIFDSYQLDNLCKSLVSSQKKMCEGNIVLDVIKEVETKRDLEKYEKRLNTIETIAKQMKTAEDSKEAQDLSNAMQTQIALLQADKVKLDIARNNEELAKSKAQKQRKDLANKTMLDGMTNHGTKF